MCNLCMRIKSSIGYRKFRKLHDDIFHMNVHTTTLRSKRPGRVRAASSVSGALVAAITITPSLGCVAPGGFNFVQFRHKTSSVKRKKKYRSKTPLMS